MATEKMFRDLALSLPNTSESSHMQHPDFRVGGKIFATLQPAKGLAMVKLTPDMQELIVRAEPEIFSPVPGAWGRQGCTYVKLSAATKPKLKDVLRAAHKNVAK